MINSKTLPATLTSQDGCFCRILRQPPTLEGSKEQNSHNRIGANTRWSRGTPLNTTKQSNHTTHKKQSRDGHQPQVGALPCRTGGTRKSLTRVRQAPHSHWLPPVTRSRAKTKAAKTDTPRDSNNLANTEDEGLH